MEQDPGVELALLERIEEFARSGGEEIRARDDEDTFRIVRELVREGLVDAADPTPRSGEVQSVQVTGLTGKGRRRLTELRQAGLRPW